MELDVHIQVGFSKSGFNVTTMVRDGDEECRDVDVWRCER